MFDLYLLALGASLFLCLSMLGYKQLERQNGVPFALTSFLKRADRRVYESGFRLLKDAVDLKSQISFFTHRYFFNPLKRMVMRVKRVIHYHYIRMLDRLWDRHLRKGGQKSFLTSKGGRSKLNDR